MAKSEEKIAGFIVDRTYRTENNEPKIHLFGRLENGESFQVIHSCKPYLYFRTADRKKAEELIDFVALEDTSFKNFAGDLVTKAIVGEPKVLSDVRKILENEGIVCFEADVNFVQQFLLDKKIYSKIAITGEFTKGKNVSRIYVEPEIGPSDVDIAMRTLSFDIETSDAKEGSDLLSIAFYGESTDLEEKPFAKTFFISNKQTHTGEQAKRVLDLKNAIVVESEKEFLEQATKTVLEYDPDIITGWNVIDFDFAFLKNKYDEHALPFIWARNDDTVRMRIESLFSRDSKADVTGRQILDGIQLFRSSFVILDEYKLDSVAAALLGDRKLITGGNKVEQINDAYKNNPQHLVDYNFKDAELVLTLLKKKDLITLTILRSNLVGLPLERVKASIASMDSLYLRELHARGYVAPCGGYVEKEEGITGGFVKDSIPGIYDWVIVLDFKSLYPSVMRTFNIDPLHHRPDCKAREGETLIESPNGTCFVNDSGILGELLERIWKERDKAKERNDGTASLAMKITMNSMFGVMASQNCRFFSMELANAITHFAQKYIKRTIAHLEKHGHKVIYGDTDSVFVDLNVNSQEEAFKIGKEIEDEMNVLLTKEVKEDYHRESFLELEFEKAYRKFLMPRARGSETGSKKRYAGLLVKGDGEKMDFTGLEFVRRDWTGLAKEFQLTLLQKVFNEEEVTDYVKKFIADLRSGKYDELLVYMKAIRKPVESYVKTTPPHIKAARKVLESGGKLESRLMKYVMTSNGPEAVGYVTGALDYDHYIEKQVRPIADTILCFFDTDMDDILSGSSQKSLFGY